MVQPSAGSTLSSPLVPRCVQVEGLSAGHRGPRGVTRTGSWWWDRRLERQKPGTLNAGAQSLRGNPCDLHNWPQRCERMCCELRWAGDSLVLVTANVFRLKCVRGPARTGSSWRLPVWDHWAAQPCLCSETSEYYFPLRAAPSDSLHLWEDDITWAEDERNGG